MRYWGVGWITALLLAAAGAGAGAPATRTLTGWIGELWQEGPAGCRHTYVLTGANGRMQALALTPQQVAAVLGAPEADGERVAVRVPAAGGTRSSRPRAALPVLDLALLDAPGGRRPVRPMGPMLGTKPYVTLLCRFADSAGTTPRDAAYFTALMGNAAPGMDHYYREVSSGQMNLAGSKVFGWYTLPKPRSYYFNGAEFLSDKALADCTAVADADVRFTDYEGINCVFNVPDFPFWGLGGRASVLLDGQQKTYGITYHRPVRADGASYQQTWAHEIGHSLGLPHSSGPYGEIYDSPWDVMSGGYAGDDPQFGGIACSHIGYHQDLLGWIDPTRKFVSPAGSTQSVRLERLDQSGAADYLLAQIDIPGNTRRFYTVEARKRTGYDQNLPAEGVIIHEVVPDRTASDSNHFTPAHVVDADGNGNPGDAGAVWVPGETFTDPVAKIQVRVDADTGSGYSVTISNGTLPAPTGLQATRSAPREIRLAWTNPGSDATAFEVERRSGSAAFTRIASLGQGSTGYTDTGLAAGTTYTYRVRGVRGSEFSGYSNEASAATDADGKAPVLSGVTVDPVSLPAAGGSVSLSADATDDQGVTGVSVEIRRGSDRQTVTLTHGTGNRYAGGFSAPANPAFTSQAYQVTFTASDAAGNTATADAGFFVAAQADRDPPTLSQPFVSPQTLLSPGGPVTLSVRATDNAGVPVVTARVQAPDGEPEVVPLSAAQDGAFTGTFTAPANPLREPVEYSVTFAARDASGNLADPPAALTFTVGGRTDTQWPTLSGARVSPTLLTSAGGPVSLSVTATDNIGVVRVTAEISLGPDTVSRFELKKGSGSSYSESYTAPANTTAQDQVYRVQYVAADAAGNESRLTQPLSFTVAGADSPSEISAPEVSPQQLSSRGGKVTIRATIRDNRKVASAWAKLNGSGRVELRKGTADRWSGTWTAPANSGKTPRTYVITLYARDDRGNQTGPVVAWRVTVAGKR